QGRDTALLHCHHARAALDARPPQAELWLGADRLWRGGAHRALAAQPECDARAAQAAAHPAGAAAGGDDEAVQGTRDESVQPARRLPADADPDAGALRAVLRVPEYD